MYMKSNPGPTEVYWALLIHLYHCNARVCKSLLAQISAFHLQRSFLFFLNQLIHKCIIYFNPRTSSAFKGVARSHARAARERRRFAAPVRLFSLRSPWIGELACGRQILWRCATCAVNCCRFKREATRISRLMQDKPRTPLETTCDWIEYVIRHGGARHLRAQVFNIPWYQYYLLDVIAFLVAIVTMVVMVIRLTCRCLCWFCCNKCGGAKTKRE